MIETIKTKKKKTLSVPPKCKQFWKKYAKSVKCYLYLGGKLNIFKKA